VWHAYTIGAITHLGARSCVPYSHVCVSIFYMYPPLATGDDDLFFRIDQTGCLGQPVSWPEFCAIWLERWVQKLDTLRNLFTRGPWGLPRSTSWKRKAIRKGSDVHIYPNGRTPSRVGWAKKHAILMYRFLREKLLSYNPYLGQVCLFFGEGKAHSPLHCNAIDTDLHSKFRVQLSSGVHKIGTRLSIR